MILNNNNSSNPRTVESAARPHADDDRRDHSIAKTEKAAEVVSGVMTGGAALQAAGDAYTSVHLHFGWIVGVIGYSSLLDVYRKLPKRLRFHERCLYGVHVMGGSFLALSVAFVTSELVGALCKELVARDVLRNSLCLHMANCGIHFVGGPDIRRLYADLTSYHKHQLPSLESDLGFHHSLLSSELLASPPLSSVAKANKQRSVLLGINLTLAQQIHQWAESLELRNKDSTGIGVKAALQRIELRERNRTVELFYLEAEPALGRVLSAYRALHIDRPFDPKCLADIQKSLASLQSSFDGLQSSHHSLAENVSELSKSYQSLHAEMKQQSTGIIMKVAVATGDHVGADDQK